jgi:hypothetical protein
MIRGVMDVSKPFTALSPGVDTDVLVVLAGSTKLRTGREIARLAGRSKTGVQRVLARLVEHGLVDRQEAGEALLYTLNREHLLAPIVEAMAASRASLFARLRDAFAGWEIPPRHASLFGSAARGDGDAASDIDLLIVRPAGVDADDPTWREQIDSLAGSVRRWTGNRAGISEIADTDVPQLRSDQPPVVAELENDAVGLAGKSVRQLLSLAR